VGEGRRAGGGRLVRRMTHRRGGISSMGVMSMRFGFQGNHEEDSEEAQQQLGQALAPADELAVAKPIGRLGEGATEEPLWQVKAVVPESMAKASNKILCDGWKQQGFCGSSFMKAQCAESCSSKSSTNTGSSPSKAGDSACRAKCTDECRKKHDKGPKKYPVCDLPFATNQYRASSEGTREPTEDEKYKELSITKGKKSARCVRVPNKRPKYVGVPGIAGCGYGGCDGKSKGKRALAKNLLSGQVGLNGRPVENENLCTRCIEPIKEGQADERCKSFGKGKKTNPWCIVDEQLWRASTFVPRCASAGTGSCIAPSSSGLAVRCTELDKCTKDAAVNSKNTLCTKWGIVTDYFDMNFLNQSSDAWKHFKVVANTWKGVNRAIARCEVVKHTACRDSSNGLDCAVKKKVTCREVCRHQGKAKTSVNQADKAIVTSEKNRMYRDCDASLCKGKFGAIACARIATMA